MSITRLTSGLNISPNKVPTKMWFNSVEGIDNYYAGVNNISVDSSGNVYTVRQTTDSNAVGFFKHDQFGNLLLQKRVRGNNYCYLRAIQVDSSGNVYIAGDKFIGSYSTEWVAKFDSSFNLVWQKHVRTSTSSAELASIYDMVLDEANSCLYTVGRTRLGSSNDKATIIKWDLNGARTWGRYVNTPNQSAFYKIKKTTDNYLICSGYTQPSGGAESNAYVVKYDSSGAMQWQTSFTEGTSNQYANFLDLDSSNNIYIGVQSGQYSPQNNTLMKLDTSGSVVWQKRIYGSYDASNLPVAIASNNKVIIATGMQEEGLNLIGLDSSGNTEWQKVLSIVNGSLATSINGLYIDSTNILYMYGVAPASSYYSTSTSENYLIKLASNGTSKFQVSNDKQSISFGYVTPTMLITNGGMTFVSTTSSDAAYSSLAVSASTHTIESSFWSNVRIDI